MLRVNAGLSRKITRDYQSAGYSINLDAEITAPAGDPKALLQQIKDLYSLAEQALGQEIDRDQGDQAIGRRDQEPPAEPAKRNGQAPPPARSTPPQRTNPPNGQPQGNDEPATNKQVQYLLTLGKRHQLSNQELEAKIAAVTGKQVGVYDLSKREAGAVIDSLTQEQTTNGKR